ncbi:MAG: alkyl sulfatase dimerization domain-containing protein [Acidimicrobiales bacterium]
MTSNPTSPTFSRTAPKEPTAATLAVLAEAAATLDLEVIDDELAVRGLIAELAGPIEVAGPGGSTQTVWDTARHDFIRTASDVPDSVHPSLWRQAQRNAPHGLFEVAPGLWQARGYDLSNISFIAGEVGWIVIDPLTTEATARACLQLANDTLGERPVTAVIYTHSHVDHFGGVLGVTSADAVANGEVRIIAPQHFLREAVFENVVAGPAMARRAAYQFGATLPAGPRQHVDSGLGKAVPLSSPGLLAPTEEITETGQELVVDGVRIVFQNTPESEAPAEMNFYFPDAGWLCMAENCSHNMHNLVPLRGAQVRDSLAWSKYINEAIELFGGEATLMFASHHWPRWGNDDTDGFLRKQRDLYRWIHDQTMRRANRGMTPLEIAEDLALPEVFVAQGHTRGYYGSLVHNVKAVYQRYLSWYDGNPTHLWQHPPVAAGTRYVALAGGADALLDHAQRAFDEGDYRWVAEVVNHLVFADPTNERARELQADAFEQLGYQSESATWRNAYLTGAQELRNGPPPARPALRRGLVEALTVDLMFDAIAIRLQDELVAGERAEINWTFTDIDADSGQRDWVLGLEHQALHYVAGRHSPDATVTVTLTKALMAEIMGGETTFVDAVTAGRATLDGDPAALITVFGHLEVFQSGFAIVEP